jgi:biofilm PGA synthesis N-glycosyltransferase PgaC
MTHGWLDRAVGIVIALITGGAAVVLWFAVSVEATPASQAPAKGALFGVWHLFYNTRVPPPQVLTGAVALAVLLAGGIALLERRASNKSRRSTNHRTTPLAPKVVMAATRGQYHGEVTVTVLIPAHNEELLLPGTLESLFSQSRPPERVIVVADNCTDATVQIAREHGVDVFEPVDNAQKKAGALNQALRHVLPGQGLNDVVMVMDADTTLDDGFLEVAVRAFTNDRGLMAVGGLFHGGEGFGLIGQLQRNEYIRYARELRRRRGRVFVLTGTASIFRPEALRLIADNRGVTIPGVHGDVYDTAALTEDNELTIALKSLGGLLVSPAECTVVTEVMPTPRALWVQRLRWERGALDNIGAYGLHPSTARYWAQQLGLGYSVIAFTLFLLLVAIMALAADVWIWFPFWLGLGMVFLIERVVTVWNGGWRARLLALSFFPELALDLFLDIIYVKGIIDITLGRKAKWGHVPAAKPVTAAHRSAVVIGIILLGVPTGILLPQSVLRSQFFAVLAALVAINTVMYAVMAVAKILPKVYLSNFLHRSNRRAETRSIHPDTPAY